MYIQTLKLNNIRSFKQYKMSFESPYAGWHVVIGDNATGKSTLLQVISLVLNNFEDIQVLRQDFRCFVRDSTKKSPAQIDLDILPSPGYDLFKPKKFTTTEAVRYSMSICSDIYSYEHNTYHHEKGFKQDDAALDAGLWGEDTAGWFSAAFGPFRRFRRGSESWDEVFELFPRLGAHLSVFSEDVSFKPALDWLTALRFQELEGDSEAQYILQNLKKLLNQGGLLPHKTQILDISSKGVRLKDLNGREMQLEEMSDGYRSVLSLCFELIRQLLRVYGAKQVFAQIEKALNSSEMQICLPGVVLIDEIDAHLHPSWQVKIGHWFTRRFPRLQFIVTTHSPLICQSADPGSIWALHAEASAKQSGPVSPSEYNRLVYGDVLEAYDTDLFGEDVSRSEQGEACLQELAALNLKALREALSDTELQRRQELQQLLPDEASTLSGNV